MQKKTKFNIQHKLIILNPDAWVSKFEKVYRSM